MHPAVTYRPMADFNLNSNSICGQVMDACEYSGVALLMFQYSVNIQ